MSDGTREYDFIAFYDEFLPQVYRYVRYRVADTAVAEDLTATIFEKALRNWSKRRNPNSVAAWIFRIAGNTVTSYYRRKGHRLQVPLDDAVSIPSADMGPEERVLRSERWARIRNGMQTLSRREQDIIALKFGSGLTNRAIAPIVGTSENNVAVILHRAMRKLHAHLESALLPVATVERIVGYG